MTKKTYLKGIQFDFDAEDGKLGGHIAFCTPAVGGPASGLTSAVLLKSEKSDIKITPESFNLMKAAKEIRVEMSFEEFVKRFFHLWGDDAALLAKILGYESSVDEEVGEEYKSWEEKRKEELQEKVESFTVLKSLHNKEKDFFALDLNEQKQVLKVQELFEKGFKEYEADLKGIPEGTNPEDTNPVNKSKSDIGDKMSDTQKLDDLIKSVESLQKALDAKDSVIKSLQDKEDARIEKAFVEKAKEYSFVEDSEAFGKFLKGLKEEDSLTILTVLDKAAESVKDTNADMFKQTSVQGEGEDKEVSAKRKAATREALKKQLNIGE